MTLLLKEVVLKGVPICSGIGIGKAHLMPHAKEMHPKRVPLASLDGEVRRYNNAVDASINDLLELQRKLQKENALEGMKILDTHLELLQDPLMTSDVVKEIRRSKKSGLAVLHRIVLEYRHQFGLICDPFFQERFLDIKDVADRVMQHLRRKVDLTLSHLPRGSILFAEDLSPSEVAALKLGSISGIVTKRGGLTSHVAIIAKSRGIPYISHLDFTSHKLGPEVVAIIDGRKGELILFPEEERLHYFEKLHQKQSDFQKRLQIGEMLAPCTQDGWEIRLYLNVNHPKELESDPKDWDGVGLFRTEFLLDENHRVPTEEEQFAIYRDLIKKFPEKPCVIRVFDVGGEKAPLVPEQNCEQNPSLGFRAIRFLLTEEAILRTQIRALLRASLYGDLRILIPMVSSIEELRECRKRIEEIKEELHRDGFPTKDSIPVGCMVEVPSAALIADHLARESDFLSFGTNDLVQYTLAVDRSNHLVSGIYTPFHPGLIRLLKHVIREANKKQVPISICGEVASDPRYTSLLIGIGLRELSLSKDHFGMIKHVIRRANMKQCRAIARKAMLLSSAKEIEALLTDYYNFLVPEDDRFHT